MDRAGSRAHKWESTEYAASWVVDAESRLAAFTELVATAVSNTASQEELARLADEQAALRRVATLVARGVPPPEVFAAVAREVGLLLDLDSTHMARYEPDGMSTVVGSWSQDEAHLSVGIRTPLDGTSISALVFRTSRPARINDYRGASGEIAGLARERGVRASAGAPVVVDGRLWGEWLAGAVAPVSDDSIGQPHLPIRRDEHRQGQLRPRRRPRAAHALQRGVQPQRKQQLPLIRFLS